MAQPCVMKKGRIRKVGQYAYVLNHRKYTAMLVQFLTCHVNYFLTCSRVCWWGRVQRYVWMSLLYLKIHIYMYVQLAITKYIKLFITSLLTSVHVLTYKKCDQSYMNSTELTSACTCRCTCI